MKVQVIEKRTGKIKTMDERYAKILVKAKFATIVDEKTEEKKTTYKTRKLEAETVEPKKRGRPAKQTYATKDMEAEE